MSVEELQAISPGFEWSKFLPEVGPTHVTSLDVSEPEYIRQFQTILTSTSVGRHQGVFALGAHDECPRCTSQATSTKNLFISMAKF